MNIVYLILKLTVILVTIILLQRKGNPEMKVSAAFIAFSLQFAISVLLGVSELFISLNDMHIFTYIDIAVVLGGLFIVAYSWLGYKTSTTSN
ncbi:hypothetical protein [Enterococcus olivae]